MDVVVPEGVREDWKRVGGGETRELVVAQGEPQGAEVVAELPSRRAPRMGMMVRDCWRTQLIATCEGVRPSSAATSITTAASLCSCSLACRARVGSPGPPGWLNLPVSTPPPRTPQGAHGERLGHREQVALGVRSARLYWICRR